MNVIQILVPPMVLPKLSQLSSCAEYEYSKYFLINILENTISKSDGVSQIFFTFHSYHTVDIEKSQSIS